MLTRITAPSKLKKRYHLKSNGFTYYTAARASTLRRIHEDVKFGDDICQARARWYIMDTVGLEMTDLY